VSYTELEILYKRYKDQGLAILAFPCNQFGEQEPGMVKDIEVFMRTGHYPGKEHSKKKAKYEHPGATFDLFDKVEVNGANTHPIFEMVKKQTRVPTVKGNFNKWLIDKHGVARYYYGKKVSPLSMEDTIKELLAESF